MMSRRCFAILLFFILQYCLPPAPEVTDPSSFLALPLDGSAETTRPVLKIVATTPPEGLVVSPSEPIVIQFNRAVLPSSCTSGGSMGSATLSYSGSTVTATPDTTWSTGISLSLSLTGCQDETATLTANDTLEFQVTANIVYIDDSGNDLNAGTAASPRQTIGGALAMCTDPCAILAGTGSYAEESISPAQNVALIGGFSNDFTSWSPSTYPTIFEHTSLPASAVATSPDAALHIKDAPLFYLRSLQLRASSDAAAMYTTGLHAENSTIVALDLEATGCTGSCPGTQISTGVYMSGGSNLTLYRGVLNGGSCGDAGCLTAGLKDSPGGQTFMAIGTTFTGGTSTATDSESAGLLLAQPKASGSSLEGCTISGGTAKLTLGARLSSFSGPILRNTFHGGFVNQAEGYAIGAAIENHNHAVRSNILFGGIAYAAGLPASFGTMALHCSNCKGTIQKTS